MCLVIFCMKSSHLQFLSLCICHCGGFAKAVDFYFGYSVLEKLFFLGEMAPEWNVLRSLNELDSLVYLVLSSYRMFVSGVSIQLVAACYFQVDVFF
jgi:hypothetical protein